MREAEIARTIADSTPIMTMTRDSRAMVAIRNTLREALTQIELTSGKTAASRARGRDEPRIKPPARDRVDGNRCNNGDFHRGERRRQPDQPAH